MLDDKTRCYAEQLQRMIQLQTVSDPDCRSPQKNFDRFRSLLWDLFPHLRGVSELTEFDGSILLKWPGADKGALPVLFMNHQDVVPAPAEGWEQAPFNGTIADGRLWGRGTLDDKGGLWAMLAAADALAAEGFCPPRDIYFVSSCNEETDGKGADTISQWCRDKGIRFEMVFDEGGDVVMHPMAGVNGTFAMIGVGEKCTVDLKFTARSDGGHASTPGKNTPLVRLGRFMAYVDRHRVFEVSLSPTIAEMLRRMAPWMGGAGKLTARADRFRRPLELLLPLLGSTANALLTTTIAFTVIGGGEAVNAIPREAWVMGNMRCSHHQGREKSLHVIEKTAKKFGLAMEVTDPGFESRLTDYQGRAFRLVEEAVMQTIPNVDGCAPYIMTGASDARFFDRVSEQCIRFLPFTIRREQMDSIHGVNEYLDLSTLAPAVAFYRYMMQHV